MKLIIVTDAWLPQVNGVVKTLTATIAGLESRGVVVRVVGPDQFRTMPLPSYGEIRLALARPAALRERIESFDPDHVHIATEGPLGWAARHVCLKQGRCFTTSYHTRFPEYLRARAPVPLSMSYRVLRRFHNAGDGVMVATQSVENELRERGFVNIMRWSRGVDLSRFNPNAPPPPESWPRPVFMTVARLAPEKNIEAFLQLDLPGTKVVVGDGPSADMLRQKFPQAVFLGARTHDELPGLYANADVFVFPSRTDTFGLVLIEALAAGLPVAAYRVAGPRDIIGESAAGVLSEDLRQASLDALRLDRAACREHALTFTWDHSVEQFITNIRQAHGGSRRKLAA
jgi:glycosyltransferase involved in cell wall biosynthesis